MGATSGSLFFVNIPATSFQMHAITTLFATEKRLSLSLKYLALYKFLNIAYHFWKRHFKYEVLVH